MPRTFKPSKKKLIPLLAVAALLIGCEVTEHYNRTKVVTLTTPQPQRAYDSVKLYQNKEEVPGAYEILAIMSVEGKAGEEAQFIKAFLYRAADLGADAVILYRVSLAAGPEGSGGARSFSINPAQDAVYRGEAIHFK
jgi:hypothetical protein